MKRELWRSTPGWPSFSRNDVVVSVVENTQADWSFGFGQAQFLTGELQVRP
jgi:hypothetical protein